MDELLPIGSVVLAKDIGLLVIIGYYPNKPYDSEWCDYICCRKRLGIRKEKDKLVINKDYFYIKKEEVITVKYIGYQNKAFDVYKEVSDILINKINDAKKENKKLTEEQTKAIYAEYLEDLKRMRSDKIEK